MTNAALQHAASGLDSALYSAYHASRTLQAMQHDAFEMPLPPGKPGHPQPVPTLPTDFFTVPAN